MTMNDTLLTACFASVMAELTEMKTKLRYKYIQLRRDAMDDLHSRECWTPEWVMKEYDLICRKASREPRRVRELIAYIGYAAGVEAMKKMAGK